MRKFHASVIILTLNRHDFALAQPGRCLYRLEAAAKKPLFAAAFR
ncbi:hypothetical protein Q9R34_06340 [Enterobacter sp. BRE11]|nr:hypothetical protein [Enterobacter sp. BRE11]